MAFSNNFYSVSITSFVHRRSMKLVLANRWMHIAVLRCRNTVYVRRQSRFVTIIRLLSSRFYLFCTLVNYRARPETLTDISRGSIMKWSFTERMQLSIYLKCRDRRDTFYKVWLASFVCVSGRKLVINFSSTSRFSIKLKLGMTQVNFYPEKMHCSGKYRSRERSHGKSEWKNIRTLITSIFQRLTRVS